MSGTRIDDTDPSVVYSGKWSVETGLALAYDGTIHTSSTFNDKATLIFQGIGILVNSGVTSWRAPSSYSIDGGTPTVYSNDTYQSTSEAYTSPTLPNGQHTLTVTNLYENDFDSPLNLDFFQVFTLDDDTESSSSSESTSFTTSSTTEPRLPSASFPTTGSTTGSSAQRLDPSSMPSPNSATKPSETRQMLLILGPILGVMVICGIINLLIRRRRKQKELDVTTASNHINQFPPGTVRLESGGKPSTFIQESNEPPPYVQDPQHSLRQPAKFRTG